MIPACFCMETLFIIFHTKTTFSDRIFKSPYVIWITLQYRKVNVSYRLVNWNMISLPLRLSQSIKSSVVWCLSDSDFRHELWKMYVLYKLHVGYRTQQEIVQVRWIHNNREMSETFQGWSLFRIRGVRVIFVSSTSTPASAFSPNTTQISLSFQFHIFVDVDICFIFVFLLCIVFHRVLEKSWTRPITSLWIFQTFSCPILTWTQSDIFQGGCCRKCVRRNWLWRLFSLRRKTRFMSESSLNVGFPFCFTEKSCRSHLTLKLFS